MFTNKKKGIYTKYVQKNKQASRQPLMFLHPIEEVRRKFNKFPA